MVCRTRLWASVLLSAVLVVVAGPASPRTVAPAVLAHFVDSSARIFRGSCVEAVAGSVEIAGATIPVTTYTFQVVESLKGAEAEQVTFRQVGAPDGGARDLGRLVGMPSYAPGVEYVLFLLPASRAGLTSPAGAAEAAFAVRDGALFPTSAGPGAAQRARTATAAGAPLPSTEIGRLSYEELKQLVLEQLHR